MSPFFIGLVMADILLLTILVTSPARVWWWAKLAAIIVVLSLNFLAWSSENSGAGWAKSGPLPVHAQFVGCQIIEPDIALGVRGAIYVWVVPLNFKHGVLSYRPNIGEPRAYHEPYDRSLHEACAIAAKAAGQGIRTSIHKGRAHAQGSRGQSSGGKYHAYLLPSPVLPRKGGKL